MVVTGTVNLYSMPFFSVRRFMMKYLRVHGKRKRKTNVANYETYRDVHFTILSTFYMMKIFIAKLRENKVRPFRN